MLAENLLKQGAGVSDLRQVALTNEDIERWKGLRDQANADTEWQIASKRERTFRAAVAPQVLDLMRGFLSGSVGLIEFQSTIDRKSRTDWDILGIKGPSGAMFLNMLTKHVPDSAVLTSCLQLALPAPMDEAKGHDQMRRFHEELSGFIQRREVKARNLQLARTPFLLSAFWHLQDSETWPVYYQSARGVFNREGFFREVPIAGPVENYFTFRRLWLELSRALALDALGLEHLILWIERQGQHKPRLEPPRVPVDVPAPDLNSEVVEEPGSLHAKAQWLLARIGKHLGFKIWIASNDRNRTWNGQSLGEFSIAALPQLGAGGATQRTVELIDVLWISGYNQIVAAFEVEHSTAIYSGLLRMSDLSVLAPLVSFPIYIVVPAARMDEVRRQLQRPTFQQLELHKRAAFFSIEALDMDAANIMKFANSAAAIDVLAERVDDVGGDEGWQ